MWSNPDVMNTTLFALGVTNSCFYYYEDYFAIEYPLPKEGKGVHVVYDVGGYVKLYVVFEANSCVITILFM